MYFRKIFQKKKKANIGNDGGIKFDLNNIID